jgi:3-isopropylmalate/(R)-2-methylmalate dehydratase small subunit
MIFEGTVHKYGRDVDTDVIIPARYLNTNDPEELASHAMEDIDADFVGRVQPGDIIVAEENFGCGSSREHAPWALQQYGFKCVIAPSYGDIFYNNSFKNGFLPVTLTESQVDSLFYDSALPGFRLVVDLDRQTVSTTDGAKSYKFDVDPSRRHALLNGLDEIGVTLRHADEIRAFEARRQAQFPWLFR